MSDLVKPWSRKAKVKQEEGQDWVEDSKVEWVLAESLLVDMTYQRPLEMGRVRRIANSFDPEAFGTLVVSIREDETMAIIDGSHRVAALHEMGWQDQSVPARVMRNLSIQDEARIFATLNANRTKPKAAEIFRAKVVAGDPAANDVQSVLESLGLRATVNNAVGGVRSISTLMRLYKVGGTDLVHDVLATILDAYDNNHSELFNHDFMIPLGTVIKDNPDIDLKRLAKAIAGVGNPSVIAARGRSVASVTETKPLNEITNLIVRAYNKGLRKRRIEEYPGHKVIFTTR